MTSRRLAGLGPAGSIGARWIVVRVALSAPANAQPEAVARMPIRRRRCSGTDICLEDIVIGRCMQRQ